MDDQLDRMIVSVRADTQGFARDVAEMRGNLEGPLAAGADRAGQAIERGLLRAVRSGKFGFEDLRRMALGVLDQIAAEALRGGLAAIGLGGNSNGGLLGLGMSLIGSLFGGSPGRATGGPVTAGRAYRVGENGPEWFVPRSPNRRGKLRAACGGRWGGKFVIPLSSVIPAQAGIHLPRLPLDATFGAGFPPARE